MQKKLDCTDLLTVVRSVMSNFVFSVPLTTEKFRGFVPPATFPLREIKLTKVKNFLCV